jgi:hypothetical protein
MLHICRVSKTFGDWYQKTNKTEDTNKLTLLAFKIIAILHNTRLATIMKLLKTVSKGFFRNRSQNQPLSHVVGLPPYGSYYQQPHALTPNSHMLSLQTATSSHSKQPKALTTNNHKLLRPTANSSHSQQPHALTINNHMLSLPTATSSHS